MDSDFYSWCLQRQEYLETTIDPIAIASELVKKERLSKAERNFVFRLQDRGEIWQRLIKLLQPRCPFGTFLDALEDCGYSIRFHRNQLEYPKRSNCRTPSRDFAQRLLVNLKTQTHNAVFANPREYLSKLSCSYYEKFVRENDFYRRQAVADKYAAVICAEIDSHIMLFKDSEITKKKIQILKGLISHTTNACVTGVAYNARMAIASSLAGEFETAEEFIRMSKTDSFNIHACVEVENMLYIEVFNLLSRYEVHPSVTLRDAILRVSDDGLQLLEYEDETSRLFWRRMFLIRMTYCLFGLSMKFIRIPGCYIDQIAIQRGKRYLAEVDKSWIGIESRRKIWYYVARARQFELECDYRDIDTALWYVNQAIELASKGNFSEGDFAVEYRKGLLAQKDLQAERETDEPNSPAESTVDETVCFSLSSPSESEDTSPDVDVLELHDCDYLDTEMSFESYFVTNELDYQSDCKHDVMWSCLAPSCAILDIKIESFLSSLLKNTNMTCPLYSVKKVKNQGTREVLSFKDCTHCSSFSLCYSRVLYDSIIFENYVLPHFQKRSVTPLKASNTQHRSHSSHYTYLDAYTSVLSRRGIRGQNLTCVADSLLSISVNLFKTSLPYLEVSAHHSEQSSNKSKEGVENFDTESSMLYLSEFYSDNLLIYTSLSKFEDHIKSDKQLPLTHHEPIEHAVQVHLEPIEHSLDLSFTEKHLSVSSLLFDVPLSLELIMPESVDSLCTPLSIESRSDESECQMQQRAVEHCDYSRMEEMDTFEFSSFL